MGAPAPTAGGVDALAGPSELHANAAGGVGLRVGQSMGWLHETPRPGGRPSGSGASRILLAELLLGTFNLLPVPPLDGSAGIMLFMSEDRAQRYLDWLRGNSFAMVGLLVGCWCSGTLRSSENFATNLLLRSHF